MSKDVVQPTSATTVSAMKNGLSAPQKSVVNSQHVNLAFDKSSEQGSIDHYPPSDSSYHSYQASHDNSYQYYQSHSDSNTSDSEFGPNHTLSSSTEHSRKSIR